MVKLLQAVVFDMDGVIAETEGDGHRVAFNEAFKKQGLKIEWDYETYGKLLKISGGKERIRHYFEEQGMQPVPEDQMDDYILDLHRKKTAFFQEMIRNGKIPTRPGIRDFIQSIINANVIITLATTSNEKAAHTLINSLLGKQIHNDFDLVLAGDVVTKKKPDPEIYTMTAQQLEIDPTMSFVVEDTRNGLLAALGAGFNVIITKSAYTKDEDFTGAAFITDDLITGKITVERLEEYLHNKLK